MSDEEIVEDFVKVGVAPEREAVKVKEIVEKARVRAMVKMVEGVYENGEDPRGKDYCKREEGE